MEGITHPPMRDLMAARGGVGIVCTEFVRVTSNPLGAKMLRKHVVTTPHARLSVQVMGNDIAQMADATALVTQAGADIVDINLGCPAPRVVRKGVGSAMLKDLSLLGRVLEAMRKATHLPLSAKIRAGFDDSSAVLDVARVVQESGADFITVHPRRRVDFYQGVADWRITRRLVEHLAIPVVGNGDVWYAVDALRMRAETGCSAVMIGRPALRNPWIFSQIAQLQAGATPHAPSTSDVMAYVDTMRLMWEEHFPERLVVGMLKEQMRYLCRAVDPAHGLLRRVLLAASVHEITDLFAATLCALAPGDLDLGAQPGRFEQSGSAVHGSSGAIGKSGGAVSGSSSSAIDRSSAIENGASAKCGALVHGSVPIERPLVQ